ncbi:hypothetical protein BYT27DRAFT_7012773, partial [Phlegmacium glaucopus]
QIRTNHFPLNAYLHKIGKLDSKWCESCRRLRFIEVAETVTHFLFECPSFNYEREELDRLLGVRSRNLRAILLKTGYIKELLRYIGRTGRLK